jgi:hypothetical protein
MSYMPWMNPSAQHKSRFIFGRLFLTIFLPVSQFLDDNSQAHPTSSFATRERPSFVRFVVEGIREVQMTSVAIKSALEPSDADAYGKMSKCHITALFTVLSFYFDASALGAPTLKIILRWIGISEMAYCRLQESKQRFRDQHKQNHRNRR